MVNLNRRHFLVAGLGSMAVIGLAACQQKGGKSGPGTGSKAKLPSTAWVRAKADEVKDGGMLKIAIALVPDNWNSSQLKGAQSDTALVRNPMGFNMALNISEHGEAKPNPDYLISVELKSENPQVVAVKFNPKAVWENGDPVTINDLAEFAKACSGKDKRYQLASSKGWEDIVEIKQTTDKFTGEIHYKNQCGNWQNFLYPELPASISKDPEKFNNGFTDHWTPSVGPFKVKKYDKSGGVITLERNPKWWGEKAKLDTIIFRATTQENLPSAFANGEFDLTTVSNGDQYDTAAKRPDAMIKTSNGLTWSHLTINTKHISDLQVRKAMATGLNRQLLAQAVIGPLKAPVTLIDNVIFMPGQDDYEKSWDLSYDKAKAAKILEDAGYKKGSDGVREKDGKKLSFSITVPAGTKSNIDRALQIQKDLNAIGFKIELKSVPPTEYFLMNIDPKAFDTVTFSWQGTIFPIANGVNLFTTNSGQNFTEWSNPAADKVGGQASLTLDKKKRAELANEFSKMVLDAVPIIPLYATPIVMAMKKNIVNYGPSQFESVDWKIVGFKK